MAMVGQRTEAIYRRYAIVDSKMLNEGVKKLDALNDTDRQRATVVALRGSNASGEEFSR